MSHISIVATEKDYRFVEDVYLFSFFIRNLVVGYRHCVAVTGGATLVSLVLEEGDGPTYYYLGMYLQLDTQMRHDVSGKEYLPT